MTTALFVGRFQPFHNGHLADVRLILEENENLIIVIGSGQLSKTEENPYSSSQRKKMIQSVLDAENINASIEVISDIDDDDAWINFLKQSLPPFDIIYSSNDRVVNIAQKADFPVKRVPIIDEISSTKIRNLMKEGDEWKKLVPKPVSDYLSSSVR